MRIADAATDARFDPSVDKATGYTTRSILAVPIRDAAEAGGRGPVRGVVQVLNRAARAEETSPSFDEEDERYLVALATQIARALSLTTLRPADAEGPGSRCAGRSTASSAGATSSRRSTSA